MIDSYKIIVKNIILDQIRQDFAGLTKQIKEKLGIQLPNLLSWTIMMLLQNTLLLFFAFFFESITDTLFKSFIVLIVLLFNFILPSSMARQNLNRVSSNPLNDLLWQSSYNRNQLLNFTLLAELIIFWLHEFTLQSVALYVIIKGSPNWAIGLALMLVWILLISSIYFLKLKKMILDSWGTQVSISKYSEAFYLVKVAVSGLFIWLICKLLFLPLIKEPISNDIYKQGLVKVSETFSDHAKYIFIDRIQSVTKWFYLESIHSGWFYGILGTLVVAYICTATYYFHSYSNKTKFIKNKNSIYLTNSKSAIFKFYRWVSKLVYPNNPWIYRDLIILERITLHTNISQKIFLIVPPAISSVIGLTIFLIPNLSSYSSFVLAFWFICWIVFSQTIWLWLWNYPILHPASELRQIDLVKMSPHLTVKQYMNSKRKLLYILLLPLQCMISIVFILSIFILEGSIFEMIVGIIGSWILFFVSSILSTYWLQLCSRFDYENIFMIRLDTYESKIMQYFFAIPKRILNGALFVVFFIGVFLNKDLGQILIYDIFLILVIVFGFSLYFSKNTKKKHKVNKI
ncbi:hypothetical protein B4117_1767 [Bacillus mycoides]|uniref:hypothetical protein n=1 Tax=Bacillus mycoides TaxID=1405 RepID=UPI0007AB81CD|nr:hypothetical protein [Bacillus mycoides]KZE06703.1 hypothetical protein B4117_1767 [Bacillus mycoides]SCC63196.1 Integral membrane protein (Possible peptide antibiotic maturation and biosynthesis protein) [Bacillus mycoides]